MKVFGSFITLSAVTVTQCHAFSNPVSIRNSISLCQQRQQVSGALYATSKENANSNSNNQKARTCVRNFLTQRSIQSFMFLLNEMRDPHTNAWMEDFLESKNLLSYHGSAALDLDRFCEWDSVFNELLDKPADFVVVEIKAKGQGRGLSEHNPYRMKEVS